MSEEVAGYYKVRVSLVFISRDGEKENVLKESETHPFALFETNRKYEAIGTLMGLEVTKV